MSELLAALTTIEYWFGVTTALAFEELVRAAFRRRLGTSQSAGSD